MAASKGKAAYEKACVEHQKGRHRAVTYKPWGKLTAEQQAAFTPKPKAKKKAAVKKGDAE